MEKGIIVVSFGTSYEETRKLTIERIENRIREEFRDSLVVGAFTSEIIIRKLKKRDNLHIYNTKEALERMKEENIRDVYLQPLHIIEGHEYEKILDQTNEFLKANKDFNIEIGKPLLSSEEDYENLVDSLNLPDDSKGEARVYMGHGSDHDADISYERLEKTIRDRGYENIFIATVEGSRILEEVLEILEEKQIKRVDLKPLMLVAGDHAINDMASDEEDSWKSILESNGIKTKTYLKGLGEIEAIQNIFINHLREIYQ